MLTAITLSVVDDTTEAPDVIAEEMLDAYYEVQTAESAPRGIGIEPRGAVVIPAEVLNLILDAAIVGLEGSEEDHAEAAFDAVTVLRANRPE